MPHCVLWRPSDWQFVLTAIELAAFVHDGDARFTAAPAGVTRIEDYREL
jgi:hypothetical protein